MVEFATAKNTNQDIFTDCLERDDRRNLQGLVDFLDDNTIKTSLIFWVESVTEAVINTQEIVVAESVTDVVKSGQETPALVPEAGVEVAEEAKLDEPGLSLSLNIFKM
jgi:hypothetical protein